MQAVILAAGLGTRMGELTKERPKPLLTIENRTLLEHNLLALPNDIDEVILVVGYLKDQITETVGSRFLDKKVTYIVQEELKGTGHALSLCKEVLRGKFLVLMADDLYPKKDLEKLISYPLALLAYELPKGTNGSDSWAEIILNGKSSVSEILERRPARPGMLVNCGAYVLDNGYFKYPLKLAGNKTREFGLPQTMMQIVEAGRELNIVRATDWHRVTSPEDLKIVSK